MDEYSKFIESFQKLTEKPSRFLEASEEFSNEIKGEIKKFYDFTRNLEIQKYKSSALPSLIVDNFDVEQIWQQIELQNESLLTRALTSVSKLIVGKNKLLFNDIKDSDLNYEQEEEVNEESPIEDINETSDDNTDENMSNIEKPISTRYKSSIVDDQFFKLDEMEQFLISEEKKLNEPDSGNDSEESADEGSVDLFEPNTDDEEDKVKMAKYKDFFVAKEQDLRIKKSRNKFLEEMDEDVEEPKSSFELRQERLNEKIDVLEEKAIREKSWQLKGEITGEKRPQNSLLEEVVEFDLTTRPAPVITEQTTMQLEDIIKQRIKDKVFDSVERKIKPIDTPLEYKKKLVLDQEKSKESLAKIYEKEYLEQQAALDPENNEKEEKEPELHLEINKIMNSLFRQLDALSNFHFTPKPAIPDLKIVSNLPAINIEEVAPVATSDAALLAPEEIKSKSKGDLMGKDERTVTDKKRERRHKKLKQKMHAKKLLEKQKCGLPKKFSKAQAVEKVAKEKNVEKMDQSSHIKELRSSKAFFTQLQDEVKTQIKRKITGDTKKKKKDQMNAKKLKL